MSHANIRWQQRFNQFKKAFLLLQTAIIVDQPSVIERAGLIQFFEMAFELGCKLLKDFEESEGVTVKSPRDAIKKAFQAGIIHRGHDWIDALQQKSLNTQVYEEDIALQVEQNIRINYFPCLQQLYHDFADKLRA